MKKIKKEIKNPTTSAQCDCDPVLDYEAPRQSCLNCKEIIKKFIKIENDAKKEKTILHLCVNKDCFMGVNPLKLTTWRQVD